jgi:glycerol-3-phosphate dehydrogenase (NAD+)
VLFSFILILCALTLVLLDRGTAVAKIAAENISEHTDLFHPVLNLWVFEETVNGEKLSNIINTKKENVKSVSRAEDPTDR